MKKLTIEKIIIIGVCSLTLLGGIIYPVASYLNYKTYYDTMMNGQNSNNQTPTITDPILQKISIRLEEGKEFFDNGKASPIKSDFIVEGTYSIGETESYVDRISNADFSLDIPNDFAINGGTITAAYEEFTASMNIILTPVKLKELYLLERPYTISYATGQSFSTEGMKLEAKLNDGTIIAVGNDYVIETKGALSSSTKNVTISFTYEGVKVTLDIPITVSDSFTNGEIVSLEEKGISYVNEKTPFSNANINLLATYESGNKTLLNTADYTIINKDETAYLGDLASAIIKTKNNVSYDVPLTIVSQLEAENGAISNGEKLNNEVSVKNNGSIVLNVETSKICLSDITLNIKTNSNSLLNKVITIKVNNVIHSISKEKLISNEYNEITLNNIKLYENTNEIKLETLSDISLDYIKLSSVGKSANEITLGEFTSLVETPEFGSSLISGGGHSMITEGNFNAMRGACTDGKYIYYLFAVTSNNQGKVVRYDPSLNSIDLRSNEFNLTDGSNPDWDRASGYLTYMNNRIYVTCLSGEIICLDAATLDIIGDYDLKIPDFSSDFENKYELSSFVYNEKMDRYAVAIRAGSWDGHRYLYIYDGDLNLIASKVLISSVKEGLWNTQDFRTLTSNDNYIYGVMSKEGSHTATIQTFDWNGNEINMSVINGNFDPSGSSRNNVENIIELNNELYVGANNYSGLNGGAIYKVTYKNMPTSTDIENNSYLVQKTEIYRNNEGKLSLSITGIIKDLTKDDFVFEYAKLDPWPWVYNELEFEMKIKNERFTVNVDLSSLTNSLDDKAEKDGYKYTKYIFYFNLKTEERTALNYASYRDVAPFAINENQFICVPYSEWGQASLKVTTGGVKVTDKGGTITEENGKIMLNLNLLGTNFPIKDIVKIDAFGADDWISRELSYTLDSDNIYTIDTNDMTTQLVNFNLKIDVSSLPVSTGDLNGHTLRIHLNNGKNYNISTSLNKDNQLSFIIDSKTYKLSGIWGQLSIVVPQ